MSFIKYCKLVYGIGKLVCPSVRLSVLNEARQRLGIFAQKLNVRYLRFAHVNLNAIG